MFWPPKSRDNNNNNNNNKKEMANMSHLMKRMFSSTHNRPIAAGFPVIFHRQSKYNPATPGNRLYTLIHFCCVSNTTIILHFVLSESYRNVNLLYADLLAYCTMLATHKTDRNDRIIIGLAGRAGSGKSTAADYLHITHNFTEISFADPLKQTCSVMFGIPLEKFYDLDAKETKIDRFGGKTPRELLQIVGTDIVRQHFDKDFWLKRAFWRLEDIRTESDVATNVVFSDVRFDNEARAVRHAGGIIIHIDSSIRLPETHLDTQAASHSSERGVSVGATDVILKNNGDILELYAELDRIYMNTVLISDKNL